MPPSNVTGAPPLPVANSLGWLAAGAAAWCISRLLAAAPGFTEATIGRVGPAIARALSLVTGIVPVSVVEIALAAYIAWRGFESARGLVRLARGRRPRRRAIAAFALTAARDAGIAATFFYILWGWNYARPPIEDRLALAAFEGGAPDESFVREMAARLVDETNTAYREIHVADDAGMPTRWAPSPDSLDAAVEEGWRRLAIALPLKSGEEARRGRGKRVFAPSLLARIGISGVYSPFTGEANVNGDVPAVALPHVLAHEKAHQRGVAPEDEANFLGCLATLASPDATVRYAGLVFAQRQLLRALRRANGGAVDTLVKLRVPGVQRDVDDLTVYWRRYEGRAAEISDKLNDAYLKTNRVEGGVASYGKSVELLMRYAKGNGGTLSGENFGSKPES